MASVFLSLTFSSCKNDPVTNEINAPKLDKALLIEQNYEEGEIVLGEKLENPYTVENMQIAYDRLNLKYNNSRINSTNKEIKTTHLYIRWLPKNWEEYDQLKNDKNLMLFDIPLDYEVKVNGNKYHDKSVPENLPTWQYTVIEKDYKINRKIKFEILAEAYIPEKDTELQKKGGRLAAGFSSEELINEALKITKNEKYLIPLNNKGGKVNNWRPAGRVTVLDTRLQQNYITSGFFGPIPIIGVQGVYVRARRFLSIESGVTDAQGYYVMGGTFGGGANYALYWEAPDFDVRSGGLGQAWVNGPFLASDWNPYFSGGVDRFYAHVFRGAWRFHYGDIGGLCRPGRVPNFTPGLTGLLPITTAAIKYAAYDSQSTNSGLNIGNWSIFGTNPNIYLWRYKPGTTTEYDSDVIFSTTVHETAHSTHLRLMTLPQFLQVSLKLTESWANAVEWFITQKEYKVRGIWNYGEPYFGYSDFPNQYGFQNFEITAFGEYTSIFIDLVDNHNQEIFGYGSENGKVAWINDPIVGYDIVNLERNVVRYTYGLSSLSNLLKNNKPIGVTDSQINTLISEF